MVVFVVECGGDQSLLLHGVGVVAGEDSCDVVLFHLFQHSVGAEIEIVARLDVCGVDPIGGEAVLFTRHHGSGDDVLLRMALHLFESDLPAPEKVEHERVVSRHVEDFLLCRSNVVNSAVAHVCHEASSLVEDEHGERGSHLFRSAIVFLVELLVGLLHGLL